MKFENAVDGEGTPMTSEMGETPKDGKAQAKADKAYQKASHPFYKKKRFILLAVIGIFAISSAISGGGGINTKSDKLSTEVAVSDKSSTEVAVNEPAIKVTAAQLIKDLEANALAVANTYDDKLVTVTGKLSNIDASGDYFSLEGADFSFVNVKINIDDSFLDTVSGFTKGQTVTVTGKVTGVGEILGYSITAESIP
jgi:hypothetical protein